ncbi:uncharacterized protein [Haliotis cracherodii]|uniref:uncharacterized protein n=1 Tax=Haliotis cracherodii TaxID=6455 RepID=UPI0039E89722
MAGPTVVKKIVSTKFETDDFPPGLQWFSPPKSYQSKANNGSGLKLNMDPQTDFWQRTYYVPELRSDNGHFLYTVIKEDKVYVETEFEVLSTNKFDQAGLMVRLDGDHWVKTGLEYSDGAWRLSCVVTNYNSDWSTTKWDSSKLTLRLFRLGDSIVVERKDPSSDNWEFIRIAHLNNPQKADVKIGLFACEPVTAPGSSVVFNYLNINETDGFHHTNA